MLNKNPDHRPNARDICAKPFIQKIVQKSFGILHDNEVVDRFLPNSEHLFPITSELSTPHIEHNPTSDIRALSIILLEMATLSPSLSLLYH